MQPFCQNPQLSRSLESELESAVKSGELKLQSKNLKDFPKHGDRYNLKDTILADLSRNKLLEVPGECTDYPSLERLLLYHNTIKSIPETISSLQSLQYLDISRNQLSYLPSSVCLLTQLQCLVANNNKLVSLPEEIGEMTMLMELDVSCNEIAHLPVQIGDLANLRSLHLRRNHLQEIPVELTYLQLTFLDLAANRLSSLPVELRFMVTLVDLYLEENPLTCPPANLCGRGRVHIFKYLEIQAIKEDKKRGVLTDGEYRRSYRKTSQLNDMRFGGGLSADARRKRNTADSGYGSEQPLDRRWSQEFSQEGDQHHTEDARRLAHRVISHRPASHVSSSHPAIKPNMMSPHHPPPSSTRLNPQTTQHCTFNRPIPAHSSPGIPNYRPHPSLTSNGSCGASSGVSSLGSSSSSQHNPTFASAPSPNGLGGDRVDSALGTGSTASPTSSVEMVTMGTNGLSIQDGKNIDSVDGKDQKIEERVEEKVQRQSNGAHPNDDLKTNEYGGGLMIENTSTGGTSQENGGGDSPDDLEKDERRRTAQRVFTKQGSRAQPRPAGRLPLPTSSGVPTPNQRSGPSSPNSSGLPSPTPNNKSGGTPTIQTYRQFKEQQRLNRQGEGSSSTYSRQGESHNNNHAKIEQQKVSDPGPTVRNSAFSAARGASQQKPLANTDIKSVQKEAVMSYMDRMGQVHHTGLAPRAGAPPETSPPPPPTGTVGSNGLGSSVMSPRHKQSFISSSSHMSKTTTTSSAHQTKTSASSIPSMARGAGSGVNGSSGASRSRFGANGTNGVPSGSNSTSQAGNSNLNFTVRREADRTAVQDTHIHHLRQQIESRLKVSLGDDLPSSLTDGVVLCHIANHVSPRAVSSIHVPSPAVPKLTAAKCRRNVDNFLSACRKIGVREEDIFNPYQDQWDLGAITRTIMALFSLGGEGLVLSPSPTPSVDLDMGVVDIKLEQIVTNRSNLPDRNSYHLKTIEHYPDIVPKQFKPPCLECLKSSDEKSSSKQMETVFLLSILITTIFILYIFPPE